MGEEMKAIIVTGGTGGHIYPALSIADGLKEDGFELLFIGSSGRMESKEIPSKGYDFIGLNLIGTNGSIFRKIKALFLIFLSYFKCIKILKEFKPDIVIGFGNYISVPPILAAKTLKIKTMIHEQNSIAGKANKYLFNKVDMVVSTYDFTFDKSEKVKSLGNPRSSDAYLIKEDYSIYDEFKLDKDKPFVFIVMGSLGSESVNKVLIEYCNNFDKDYSLFIVSGKNNFDDFKYISNDNIKVVPYVDSLRVMKMASLIVSRSGATTCSEITALKKPSILIPSPYVPNNHQYINAAALEKEMATVLLNEKDLTYKSLNENIDRLMSDDNLRNEIGENAFKISKINAKRDIIDWIEKSI